jgi:hypothetical protein
MRHVKLARIDGLFEGIADGPTQIVVVIQVAAVIQMHRCDFLRRERKDTTSWVGLRKTVRLDQWVPWVPRRFSLCVPLISLHCRPLWQFSMGMEACLDVFG